MRTLELFCGTKSFSNVAQEFGHSVLTIDNDHQHLPDICQDIMTIDPSALGTFDVVWASPPCQAFSVAVIGKNWNKDYTPKHARAELGLRLVQRTLYIINELKPKYWFIENPMGMLRKMPMMNVGIRHLITYCQYGDTRMKPTDIWTNCLAWKPKQPCKYGAKCHEPAPRGSRTGTQGIKGAIDRSRIPRGIFVEIFNTINPPGA